MRFFLVGRDRMSGVVRIVSEQPSASRQEAIDSFAFLAPSVEDLTASDYFVVDLESVTPVVIYRTQDAFAAVDDLEPIADAWETPGGEPSPLLEPVDDVRADTEALSSEDGLAAALRRAATSMEAAGVVPAATVEDVLAVEHADVAEAGMPEAAGSEDDSDLALAAELDALASVAALTMSTGPVEDEEPADEPVAEVVAPVPDEPVAEAVEVVAPVPDEPVAAEAAAPEPVAPEAAAWPWETETAGESAPPSSVDVADVFAGTFAAPIEEPAPEPEGTTVQEAAPSEGSAQDDVPLAALASILDEETPSEPPDILASLSLLPPLPAEEPAETEVAPVPDGEAGPIVMPGDGLPLVGDLPAEPIPSLSTEGPRESAGARSDVSAAAEPPVAAWDDPFGGPSTASGGAEPVDEALATVLDEAEAAPEPLTYEPQEIDMNSYTCEDCVYVSTCPKAGEESPASCGSFQWKSV